METANEIIFVECAMANCDASIEVKLSRGRPRQCCDDCNRMKKRIRYKVLKDKRAGLVRQAKISQSMYITSLIINCYIYLCFYVQGL